MHDSFLMHVFECTGDLFHEVPDGGLIELEIFALFFFDEFFEVSSFCPLCDNDELIVVYERVDILYDMWMIKFFHDVDFSKAFFSLSLIGHIKDLDSMRFTLIFLSAKGIPC